MSFSAGAITGTMGLDISGYTQGMLQATSIASLFPAVVTNFLANPLLAVIGVAKDMASSVVSAFLEIGRAADNAGEQAEKVGVSVEFLTGVGAAAKDAGSSVQGLADAMKFLNNNAADAAGGKKEIAQAFADVGISVTDATGKLKNGEVLFFEVADAMKAIEDPAKRTQAAMNLMGKGGTDLIPLLNKGSESIKGFAGDIAKLGGAIDSNLAAQGDKFGTLETLVEAALMGIKKAVAEPILNLLGDNFDLVKEKIFQFSDAIRGGLAAAIKFVTPVIQAWYTDYLPGLMSYVRGIADLLSSVLVPALKIVISVVEVLWKVLGPVMDIIGKILSSIGGVIRGTTDAIGLTGGGGGGTSNPAAGIVGPGGVSIAQVNIQSPPLTEATTSRIASSLRSPLQEAIRGQTRQIEGAFGAAAVKGGLSFAAG